jgi:raffinose/stachyose/melibiose transport system substrate-binding protein
MPSERKRRAEIVRLIVITRERFPHTPRLTSALKRVLWKYVATPLPASARQKRRTKAENIWFIQAIVAVLVIASLAFSGCAPATPVLPTSKPITPTPRPQREVVLTMGAWRPEDVEQMVRILGKFHERYPNVSVKYDPTSAPEYNAALQAQLAGGTGPDIFYLRSFTISRKLFEQGYLEPLDTLPGLKENFSTAMRVPWATEDGKPYGVPYIATSHGIYYNADLFRKLNLVVPSTWEELLAAANAIQAAGVIPFANASGDPWTMAEIVFMNLAPNFVGGREGRLAYLTGQRCFNDKNVVAVLQAIKDIALFLPPNQAVLTYQDSQQLFLQGKAAMWLGGSWDIPFFEAQKPGLAWSVFAPPPPAGQPAYLTFHLDAGMGLNAASKHKAEARTFLEWMTTSEFAGLLGDELPGFFPLHTTLPTLKDEHANTFLALNKGRGTDIRFAWDKLMDGAPSGYDLIQNGTVAVVKGEQSPQQAADALQAGLAQWFAPARTCR